MTRTQAPELSGLSVPALRVQGQPHWHADQDYIDRMKQQLPARLATRRTPAPVRRHAGPLVSNAVRSRALARRASIPGILFRLLSIFSLRNSSSVFLVRGESKS